MSDLFNKLIDAIAGGKFDDNIELLSHAVNARRAEVKARTGLRVKLQSNNPHMRPAYLIGCPGICEGPIGNKGRRWVFIPDPGTRAAQRGARWKINFTSFDEESQVAIREKYGIGWSV